MKNPGIPKWFGLGGTFKRSSSPNLQKAGTPSGKDQLHPFITAWYLRSQHYNSHSLPWLSSETDTPAVSAQESAVLHVSEVQWYTQCLHPHRASIQKLCPGCLKQRCDRSYIIFPKQESNLRLNILNYTRAGNYVSHWPWSITFPCLAPSLNQTLSISVQVETRIHTDNSSAHAALDPALGAD